MKNIKFFLVILLFISVNTVLAQARINSFDNVGANLRLKANDIDTDVISTSITDTQMMTHWELIDAGGGYVYIQNRASGMRLQGTSTATGTQSSVKIVASTATSDWVQWKLTPVGSNWFIDNRAHNTRLTISGSGAIVVGSTSWGGSWMQWKLTNASTYPAQFSLLSFTPVETTKVPVSGALTFTFTEAVNLTTANNIDVYVNKSLANGSVNWTRSTYNTLTLRHNSRWAPGSLIGVRFRSAIRSLSGSTYGRQIVDYEFIVDTEADFGFERINIPTLVTRNGGAHNIPMLVALPTDRSNKVPVQFWVHGGGWSGGTIAESVIYPGPHSEYLAEELGIATIEVAYRCTGSNGNFTQAMQDLDAAYQWAVNNASRYNLDLNNSFFAGGSAGTPLSALAAQRYPSIKAYVGYNGIYNFVQNSGPFGTGNDYGQQFPSARENSAIYNLRANPPATLLLHGNADNTINYTQSTLFAEAIRAKGGSATAIIYNGEAHSFFPTPSKPQYEDCLWEMSNFLKNNGITQVDTGFENGIYKIDHIGANLRLKSNSGGTDVISTSVSDSGWLGSWTFIDAGNGYFFIQNQANGTRLQGTSTTLGNQSSVKLVSGTSNGDWVQWKLTPVGTNWFIDNRAHNTRLSMNGSGQITVGSTNWGGNWVQWRLSNIASSKQSNYKLSTTTELVIDSPKILIYPNIIKSGNYFNLHYYLDGNDDVLQIRIIDVSGKVIVNKKESLNNGLNKLKIGSHGLSHGLYFVELSSKGASSTKKIVIN